MKIAVCEDDVYERKMIQEAMEKSLEEMSLEAGVKYFSGGGQLLETIRQEERYHLYLLDIMLEDEKDGIEIAKELRKHNPDAMIAFLTSNKEHAIEAFEIGAIHYLVKPVTKKAVREILERWQLRTAQQADCLKIQEGRETRKFVKSQILYIRSRDGGIEIHMKLHKWDSWVKYSFGGIEEKLKTMPQFIRIARGFLVNLDNVQRIDSKECVLINGKILSISRREQSEVMNKYNDYLFFKMEQEGKRGM